MKWKNNGNYIDAEELKQELICYCHEKEKIDVKINKQINLLKKKYEVDTANYIKEKEKIDKQHKFPQVSDRLGELILLIGKNYFSRANVRYSPIKDDAMMLGIEYCLKYMHNYNPKHSAFNYISTYMENSYKQYWNKEQLNKEKIDRKINKYVDEECIIGKDKEGNAFFKPYNEIVGQNNSFELNFDELDKIVKENELRNDKVRKSLKKYFEE